jgi:hypothetical protein
VPMFFGDNQSREVGIDLLEEEIGKLFDKKLEKFTARASKISARVEDAKREFVLACNEFEKVSDEPDLEFKRWLNANFIKGQKQAYAAALKEVFSTTDKPSGQVSYSRYSAELAALNSVINEMLSINGRNRDIIHAYSKHLGHFKYLQATLENLAASLRTELERASGEFNEYNDVVAGIAKIRASCDEIDSLKNRLESVDAVKPGSVDAKAEIGGLEARASAKRTELAKLEMDIDEISSRIASLILPLEKAARVYDHSAMKKVKLFEMVENPVHTLASEEGFGEFSRMIEGLKDSIEKNRIELKKPGETLSLISRIRGANIYEELSRLALLNREAKVIEGEIRLFEKDIEGIKSKAWESESTIRKISDMNDAIKRLEGEKREGKAALEQLITKYYKKKIVVML